MFSLIKKLNNFIVILFLIPVYFIIFGVAFIIHKLTARNSDSSSTYWEEPSITKDFTSPY